MIWLIAIAINWGIPLIVSWVYVLWLWKLSHDITFEGWVIWRRTVPIARFRLISEYSWYAKLWANWSGFAMMLLMIHRYEGDALDDSAKLTIVHETYHVIRQILPFGLCFWLAYLATALVLKLRGKSVHRSNPFEDSARHYAAKWQIAGRPPIVTFGDNA